VREGLAMLELAAGWGSPLIRVFGGPPAGTSADAATIAAAESLAPLAERGRELGVAVALETHDAFASGESVQRVLSRVPTPAAGAIWDTLHPYRMGERMDETLDRIGDRLLHVHVKDGARPPGGGTEWPLTLLGRGDVPVREILVALQRRGYGGWLAVEWEKKWHPELDEPEVALPQHAELLRSYLQQP
jgi:sugar phosphate isomerase/epimerase